MAKDMICKLCENADDQEVGIMLISDLTGSGTLPFAVGLRCLPIWLAEMQEVFALPDGIPPSAPAELSEEGPEVSSETPQTTQELVVDEDSLIGVVEPPASPEVPTEASGPSPVESSDPVTGNGRRGQGSRGRTAIPAAD